MDAGFRHDVAGMHFAFAHGPAVDGDEVEQWILVGRALRLAIVFAPEPHAHVHDPLGADRGLRGLLADRLVGFLVPAGADHFLLDREDGHAGHDLALRGAEHEVAHHPSAPPTAACCLTGTPQPAGPASSSE